MWWSEIGLLVAFTPGRMEDRGWPFALCIREGILISPRYPLKWALMDCLQGYFVTTLKKVPDTLNPSDPV